MQLPQELAEWLDGLTPVKVDRGESGASVFRYARQGRRAVYLKRGRDAVARHILDEVVRLRWLNDHLPSPRLLRFGGDRRDAWMVTEALSGCSAYDVLASKTGERVAVVRAIASFLRHLHALPVGDCPFRSHHSVRMAQAHRNLQAGLVDTTDFDEQRQGWTAQQVWSAMTGIQPTQFGEAVTHGDFSLDNIFLDRGKVTGVVDVGRLGVADPYQDLAIVWNSLGEFGAELQKEMLRAYGIARVDRRKLEFHLCLDEFF